MPVFYDSISKWEEARKDAAHGETHQSPILCGPHQIQRRLQARRSLPYKRVSCEKIRKVFAKSNVALFHLYVVNIVLS